MKKNKKIVSIFIAIIILIIVVVVYINKNDSKLIYVKTFKHINTSSLVYGNDTFINKDDKYFAAIIMPKRDEITIEENIIKEKDIDGDILLGESIIYSKDKIKRSYAQEYLYKVHDYHRCGVSLKRFRKVRTNYYYIKYEVPSEC